jgi:hypothetical protein
MKSSDTDRLRRRVGRDSLSHLEAFNEHQYRLQEQRQFIKEVNLSPENPNHGFKPSSWYIEGTENEFKAPDQHE